MQLSISIVRLVVPFLVGSLCVACESDPPERATAAAAVSATEQRVVDINAGHVGFLPPIVEARPGEALTLRFTRTTTSGCLGTISVPALGIRRDLPLGQPVDVAVSAPGAGSLAFECGMGMVKGKVVVTGGGAASAATPAPAAPEDTAGAHADHDPRHGGVLTMEGDHHVEIVVAADGRVDLHVSDAFRRPIAPTEVTGTIGLRSPGSKSDTHQLPLTADATRGALSAAGPASTEPREYTWKLAVRGQPLTMTLAVPAGGTAKLASEDDASGGVVQKLGDGHVETELSPSGELTVRLLDAERRKAPARGAAATVRGTAPGSKPVALVYDEPTDTLRGKLPVQRADHVKLVVSVTLPGKKPVDVPVTFHGEAGKQHAH